MSRTDEQAANDGEVCANCFFWRPMDSSLPTPVGQCRISGPTYDSGALVDVWPISRSMDWCGDFEPDDEHDEHLYDY